MSLLFLLQIPEDFFKLQEGIDKVAMRKLFYPLSFWPEPWRFFPNCFFSLIMYESMLLDLLSSIISEKKQLGSIAQVSTMIWCCKISFVSTIQ